MLVGFMLVNATVQLDVTQKQEASKDIKRVDHTHTKEVVINLCWLCSHWSMPLYGGIYWRSKNDVKNVDPSMRLFRW